jgi:hypothetical protein
MAHAGRTAFGLIFIKEAGCSRCEHQRSLASALVLAATMSGRDDAIGMELRNPAKPLGPIP